MSDIPAFHSDAPFPTQRTVWLRTFVPFQLLRFLQLNVRMIRMVLKAHH